MKKTSTLQWKMSSPSGKLYLAATEKGLSYLGWTPARDVPFIKSLNEASLPVQFLQQAVRELNEYFLGKRTAFEVPLDIQGTDFQKKVWTKLIKIPFGKTKSYKQIAESLRSQAMRAVGSANGKNKICIIIPCHRVINANGNIGGFSGGLGKKEFLLQLERQL